MPPLYTQSAAMRSKSHAYVDYGGGFLGVRGSSVSVANLTNMVDRSQPYQKFAPSNTSFQTPRRSSTTSMPQSATMGCLPTYSNETSPMSHPPKQFQKLTSFRAAEKGIGTILPQNVQSEPQHGYSSDGLRDRKSRYSMDSIRDMSQRLRSRKRTSSADVLASQMDPSDVQSWNSRGAAKQGGLADYSATTIQKQVVFFSKVHPFKKREWAQILVIAVVFFLVFDSYTKAVSTTEKLEHFQAEESMMMMHLQRIEQQWIKLHENMSRLASESTALVRTQSTASKGESMAPESVDSELLRVQTQQLYQMEEELDRELHALQEKLQSIARSSIVRTFGEGPVQATLELEFPDGGFGSDRANIAIMLWYDTPHAAWTWIQQIRKGDWDGAVFEKGKGFSVDAAPLAPTSSSLDFVERSQKGHEAWTVGLTEDGGRLKMFINLQDNSESRKYDVCVGKIIDGFDALQRLVDLTRHDSAAFVTIKQARAGHLARHQTTF